MPVRRTRLAAWQGTLTIVIGGIAAQVAGAAVFVVGIAMDVAQGGVGALDALGVEALLARADLIALSIVATGTAMASAALLMPLLARAPLRSALGLVGAPWPCFVAAPIGILALSPTSDLLLRFMRAYFADWTLGSLGMIDSVVQSAPLLVILPLLSVLPGVSEELLFRGAFQRSISRAAIAIPLSGVLFAAYHLDPHHVVAVVPLGLYLAWVAHVSQSTLVTIVAHVCNNAVAVIAGVWLASGEDAADAPMTAEDIAAIPIGWAIAALAMYVVWWSVRRPRSREALAAAGEPPGAASQHGDPGATPPDP